MKLNSARQAWHDCLYQSWDSVMSLAAEWALLGTAVQTTAKSVTANHAAHQALAGRVQQAIDTLPGYVRAFGHHLYSPLATDGHREAAEAAVFLFAYDQAGRMTAKKAERARYVAMGVLYRYRRQHQGGQSACLDPLATPEAFRAWLDEEYGIELASENWGRDWEPFVQLCFDTCNDLDRKALAPVAMVVGVMMEAA